MTPRDQILQVMKQSETAFYRTPVERDVVVGFKAAAEVLRIVRQRLDTLPITDDDGDDLVDLHDVVHLLDALLVEIEGRPQLEEKKSKLKKNTGAQS